MHNPQLAVVIGDSVVQIDPGVLVEATTSITKHSTQPLSILSQPDLAILDAAFKVSVSGPDEVAVAVAEDFVEFDFGFVGGAVSAWAVGHQVHGVVVDVDSSGALGEVAAAAAARVVIKASVVITRRRVPSMASLAVVARVATGAVSSTVAARGSAVSAGMLSSILFFLLLLMMVFGCVFELVTGKGTSEGTQDAVTHFVATISTCCTSSNSTHEAAVAFNSRLSAV